MKNILKYTIQSLAFFFMLAGLVFTTSCEEEDSASGEVVLLSFGPAGVEHGDEITFVGQNLDKVTAIVFPPSVEVAKEDFTSQTSEMIKVIVPEAAEPGTLTLKTPDGDIETQTILNFEVPVTITNMTASAKPGTDITITGDKLNWIESITFTSDKVVEKADFVSQSLTELVVTVPMDAQSGFLIFRSGGTDPLVWASETQLDVTIPVITALNPTSIRHAANLTIEGTDLDLVTEIVFFEGVSVTEFVSQSSTSIVVAVPSTVETGTVTLRQLSPVEVVSADELAIILPIGTSVSPSPAVPGEDDITITGTDLDLVAEIILPGAGSVTTFISQSPTEIVLAVPSGAVLGPIDYVTIHGYSGGLGVLFRVPAEGPQPLLVSFYDDARNDALVGAGGGWSSTTDWASTENAREGDNSIKVTYTGNWGGGAQFGTWGRDPVSIVGSEIFAFSIFGGTGTAGQSIQYMVKTNAGDFSALVSIDEGAWKDVEIPLADLGNATTVTEVFFQNTDQWAATVYFDRIGFGFPSGPPELTVIAYDDTRNDALFGAGGGWSSTQEWESTENTREGTSSIKVTYTGNWGGAAQFGTWGRDPVSIAGTEAFAFSIFGGTGTTGQSIQYMVKTNAGDFSALVTIDAGEWKDVAIPIADLGNATSVTEIFFQNTDQWTGIVYLDYIGFR